MPANVLAKIYEKHGQKLLEQNVRRFLGDKETNKNMLITIKEASIRFFAYNNGLTCTAEELTPEKIDGTLYLKSAKGLQIVNGGQTTNVIYKAFKEGCNLDNVSVQMKLSVVKDSGNYPDFVEKVARYANTQNPLKKSGFSSNSPFHKKIEEISRDLWAPAPRGGQNETKWYYERTTGQYVGEYSGKGKRVEDKFLRKNPRDQKIDKVILARTETIFHDAPYVASNQQKAFAYFTSHIQKEIEDVKNFVNEKYFKEFVSKVLLTKVADDVLKKPAYKKNQSKI
jgi:hypothetical protein